MKKNIILLGIIFSLQSCKSLSSDVKSDRQKDYNQIEVIIEDFYKNNPIEIKKYNVFDIDDRTPNSNYYLFNILPVTEHNFYIMDLKDPYLPKDVIRYKSKFFLLHSDNITITNDRNKLLKCLDSLNLLDSTNVKVELGLLKPEDAVFRKMGADDSLEGINYILCKDNPLIIKQRIKTHVYIEPTDKRFSEICN